MLIALQKAVLLVLVGINTPISYKLALVSYLYFIANIKCLQGGIAVFCQLIALGNIIYG